MKRSVSTHLITLLMIGSLTILTGCQQTMRNDPSCTVERSPYGHSDTFEVQEYCEDRVRCEPTRPSDEYSSDCNMCMDKPLEPVMGDSYSSSGLGSDYTVQKGDTLWAISRRMGVSVNQLAELNGMNKDERLKIGQHLKVPGTSTSGHSVSSSSSASSYNYSGEYTVQSGDSLSLIAKRTGSSISALKQANGLSGDLIRVGQTLKVPTGSSSSYQTSSSNASSSVSTSENGRYTVRSGDTISGIASRFRMKSSELIALNNLSNPNRLSIGQVLVVRGDPTSVSSSSESAHTASTAKRNSVDEGLDLFADATLATDTTSDSTIETDVVLLGDAEDDDALFDNTEEVDVVPVEEDRI